MSALMIIDDYKTDCSTYAGFGCITRVHELIAEHAALKKQIKELHYKVMNNRYGDAFSYFVSASGQNSLHETLRIERFFELERALCALDQDYWNQLIDVINVKNFMPAAKRDKWFDDLNKWRKADRVLLPSVRPMPFDTETVLNTAKSLFNERRDFFSEMVDGVFCNLSPKHFTNKSEGFSVRMIVDHVMPSLNRDNYKQEYINDLRKIIGLMLNREGAETVTSHNLLDDLKKHTGEWVSIDCDSISIKPHKNGTVHLQISQGISDALNIVLAHRYPNVIPLVKKRGEKRKFNHFINDREYPLYSEILPFRVSDYFGELARENHSKSAINIDGENFHVYSLPGTYIHTSSTNDDVKKIFLILGGQEDKSRKGRYRFEYDPKPVFEYMFVNGTLPDQDSHQFYPTKGDVRQQAVDQAEISEFHTLLEPEAGFGDLLQTLPNGVDVTAIEIHPVAAATLRAKGFKTVQGDFLKQQTASLGLFDRVLMNPPYSDSRWLRHLLHALNFIKPGGKLVAILPASAKANDKINKIGEGYDVSFSNEHARAFEGAFVNVVIMTVDRHV